MSTAVRRTAYGLGAAACALLALVVLDPSAAGAAGANSISASTVKSKYFSGTTTISCPSGWIATGGGVGADLTTTHVVLTEPRRNSTGRPYGWKAWLSDPNGADATGTIYVVCAR